MSDAAKTNGECSSCGEAWPCSAARRVNEALGLHWCETKECWLSMPKHKCPRCAGSRSPEGTEGREP